MSSLSIFDPNNPIAQRCAEGTMLEHTDRAEASRLFTEAWTLAATVLEASCAAHYLARVQEDTHAELYWNKLALEKALTAQEAEAALFLPSLYLNLGHSYETIGDTEKARMHYQLAQNHAGILADDGYGKMIQLGIEAALARV